MWKIAGRTLLAFCLFLIVLNSVAMAQIDIRPIGTYASGLFDESAAESVAHDPNTQRLYVVNANSGNIDVLDINNPANPTLLFQIDTAPYGDGANSVAVHDGIVAVAVQADPKQTPGTTVFFNQDGEFLSAVTVGALPDMLTFTPDGQYVLVANEGEPDQYCLTDDAGDPEGSVSVISLMNGVTNLTQSDVRTADFSNFTQDNIHSDIRIFGPRATVAQDLEPEYIAVDPDSSRAWVALQENNAMAVLDIASATITDILPFGYKDYALDVPQLRLLPFEPMPSLGTTTAGQEILLGGFSGLFFEGINPENGNLQFITHPDRGPNADAIDVDEDGVSERPFPLPDYQAQWIRFEVSPHTAHVHITERIPLTRADGTPITGLPNLQGPSKMAYADEEPVDLLGQPLEYDPFGADFEGIVRADDGTYWMVDEYRPAIYHFMPNGTLINRYVPEGSNASGVNVGIEAIPALFAQRRANRGFEAVAYQNGMLYTFIQSPIDNPDVDDDANSKAGKSIRILEFDTTTMQSVAQYLYMLEGNGSDKIGDAVASHDGGIYVLERDSAIGPTSQKYVFRIDLAAATNIHGMVEPMPFESLDETQLLEQSITPVMKELVIDLAAAGYDFADKPEGLARLNEDTFAVLNDNDFGLLGSFDPATGLLDDNPNPQTPVLGIVSLHPNGLDPSDRDDAINIANWPVRGMYQPDAIATFQSENETFIISVNEGDARDYECFSEEVRVEDLSLDPAVFDNPASLQEAANLGRLKTTTATGDADGDGHHETIFNYGARSFSIWSVDGQLVFDSGSDFEQRTAALIPDDFNSTNDENGSFDNRSDDKGPEPEGVTIGRIGDRVYAFMGFERVGGIMVYDVTDPYQPTFVQYVNNRDFSGNAEEGTAGDLGPEGILFIDEADSPIGYPLLITGNEVSGTTTIFTITGPAVENAFTIELAKGLNMISVPLKPIVPYTARSLMTALSSTVLIQYNTQIGGFQGFTADAPGNGFDIKGGQGYIVNVPNAQTFTFKGSAWTNPASPAAPTLPVDSTPSAWAFVVSGRFTNTANGYTVSVTNTRTNATVTDIVQHGYYAAVFADLTQKAVVQAGDVITVSVLDSAGHIIGETAAYTVTPKMIETAFVSLALDLAPQPETTLLLQNYPNPFNPETWMPYQLSEPTAVTITLYDVTGNVVRSLNLGHQAAGFYRSRSQAAYWDGRNNLGEPVASGIYFYQIQAGEFSATRRMLILK